MNKHSEKLPANEAKQVLGKEKLPLPSVVCVACGVFGRNRIVRETSSPRKKQPPSVGAHEGSPACYLQHMSSRLRHAGGRRETWPAAWQDC